ncbi:GntR family transcriptional regulator [Zwartia sp.]|uniref:GntR family transcriptional regulator n=1 Tax=Zwartia sp. TaxID=2978004 RepID=UPI002723B800|nr:GntR family transcriptional regulator [Zwartia sp.]MDO9023664.1 GntR family transcriptional regulator [Zwartia sp.]
MKFAPLGTTDFKVPRAAAVLRHSVTESIRNAILLGHFQPGERLPERELCEMTGVSRTLVREALRQLESERLICVIPHRGPIVETVSVEQADGIYRVREELEGLASQLFAERASDEQLKALQAAYDNIKNSMSVKDPLVQLSAKNDFYSCLLAGAGNEALLNTLKLLNSQVMLLRSVSMQVPGRSVQSLEELGVLMNALIARDGKAARKAGSRHVRHAAAAALKLMRESKLAVT